MRRGPQALPHRQPGAASSVRGEGRVRPCQRRARAGQPEALAQYGMAKREAAIACGCAARQSNTACSATVVATASGKRSAKGDARRGNLHVDGRVDNDGIYGFRRQRSFPLSRLDAARPTKSFRDSAGVVENDLPPLRPFAPDEREDAVVLLCFAAPWASALEDEILPVTRAISFFPQPSGRRRTSRSL